MKQLETHDPLQDIPLPEPGTMTLEEFLENDVEGFEYVKGELVPMPDASRRHGEVYMNIIHYLYSYVRQHKLGRMYPADTSFKVGERVLKPDVAFVSTDRLTGDYDKGLPIPPTSQLRWFLLQIFSPVFLIKYVLILTQERVVFGCLNLY